MKWASSYLKMRILGAIDYAQASTIKQRIKKVSTMAFTDEEGNPRRFTWRTIATWYYRYKVAGITGVTPKTRSDKGKTRKITPEELLEAINQVLPYFREKKYNKTDIYRMCIEKGIIHSTQIAPTTFYRFVKEYELLKEDVSTNKKRLAFSMQYANQLWQADTMYGPYVKNEKGIPTQTRLIAFIDDASRLLCHGQFFCNENVDALICAIKSALYKRGIPEMLYVDNGSIYTCKEITLICARIGCIIKHAPLRDGAAKGKIERFFRTVRGKFLSRNLELKSLDSLNKQFTRWAEDHYNNVTHSAIGLKPVDRFTIDSQRIRYLEPHAFNDELFYAEDTRKVKKDNTFSFNSLRFEAPADLRDKRITIRFDRTKKKSTVIVYYKNQRIGHAQLVNLVHNGTLRQRRKTV
ncbi:MAG: DDE-type integrase/transposase/recombinase [Candidatus Cloacimonetes bacterium]|nr:DDE-type integrase/transposase/recombinase [Candidatus Cloacimonadota bacterium]